MKQLSHYLLENPCHQRQLEKNPQPAGRSMTLLFSKPVCKWSNQVYLATICLPNSRGDLAKQRSYYLPENLCRRHSRRNPSQVVEARRALFSKPVYRQVKPCISCCKPVKALINLSLRVVSYRHNKALAARPHPHSIIPIVYLQRCLNKYYMYSSALNSIIMCLCLHNNTMHNCHKNKAVASQRS